MINNLDYNKKIKLPNQLIKKQSKCKKCGFNITYYKENLKVVEKAKILICPECGHKEVFF